MPLALIPNLKENIETKIEELADHAYEQKALILTETDLQCLLYKKLYEIDYLSEISETEDGYITNKIHTEISWYDSNQHQLKIRPDITLLKPENLKITSGFDRELPSKGLHSNDGGIMFEIKFDRELNTITERNMDGIFKDIRNFKYIYDRFNQEGLEDEIYGYFIFFIKSHPYTHNINKINRIHQELAEKELDETKCKFIYKFLEV